MQEKVLQTQTAELRLGDDGIVRILPLDPAVGTVENARDNVRMLVKLTGKKKNIVFVDISKVKFISREVRRFYAGREVAEHIVANALLVGSHVSRVFGNFFIGINNPEYPLRLFASEQKAIDWLKGFV